MLAAGGRGFQERYFSGTNIAARLNLLNMRYDSAQRVEVCARAQDRLAELKRDREKGLK